MECGGEPTLASAIVLTAAALGSAGDGTRFHVAETNGRAWLVASNGKRFLSLGVCCVGRGDETFDPLNPGYVSSRFYKSKPAWASDAVSRLESWSFNTAGAWSEHALLRGPLFQTPVLHLGSSGIPWKDMWDPKVVTDTYKIAEDQIKLLKMDPNVIGYFSDNELGWWEGAMFEWAWKATPQFGTRKRLVDLLRARYGSWQNVLKDFDPESATSFDELEQSGRIFLRPGGNGMGYVRAVMAILASRYYRLCKEAILRSDPHALFLGDRYISNFYPEVAMAAGATVDVVSTNFNANWPDGSAYRYYLDELHRLSKKPVMITEYYSCAMENGSGNMNDASGFPTVRTQKERTAGAMKQLRAMIEKPYVVGAHWFQYWDEPMHGRGDGENYDFGLLDTQNLPYKELTSAFKSFRAVAVHSNPPTGSRVSESGGIPMIEPLEAKDLANWPRDSAYQKHLAGDARGDLYVAWHRGGLFIGLAWDEDRFAEAYYRSGTIPAQDRARFEMSFLGRKRSVEAVIGQGGEMELTNATGISHVAGTRCTAIFRIPSNFLGNPQLSRGDRIRFSAQLQTRGRAYTMHWKADRTLLGKTH